MFQTNYRYRYIPLWPCAWCVHRLIISTITCTSISQLSRVQCLIKTTRKKRCLAQPVILRQTPSLPKREKKKRINKRDRQKIVPRVNAKRLLQALTIWTIDALIRCIPNVTFQTSWTVVWIPYTVADTFSRHNITATIRIRTIVQAMFVLAPFTKKGTVTHTSTYWISNITPPMRTTIIPAVLCARIINRLKYQCIEKQKNHGWYVVVPI